MFLRPPVNTLWGTDGTWDNGPTPCVHQGSRSPRAAWVRITKGVDSSSDSDGFLWKAATALDSQHTA
eukprot:6932454-Prymnesium_polylepis.4